MLQIFPFLHFGCQKYSYERSYGILYDFLYEWLVVREQCSGSLKIWLLWIHNMNAICTSNRVKIEQNPLFTFQGCNRILKLKNPDAVSYCAHQMARIAFRLSKLNGILQEARTNITPVHKCSQILCIVVNKIVYFNVNITSQQFAHHQWNVVVNAVSYSFLQN